MIISPCCFALVLKAALQYEKKKKKKRKYLSFVKYLIHSRRYRVVVLYRLFIYRIARKHASIVIVYRYPDIK